MNKIKMLALVGVMSAALLLNGCGAQKDAPKEENKQTEQKQEEKKDDNSKADEKKRRSKLVRLERRMEQYGKLFGKTRSSRSFQNIGEEGKCR